MTYYIAVVETGTIYRCKSAWHQRGLLATGYYRTVTAAERRAIKRDATQNGRYPAYIGLVAA